MALLRLILLLLLIVVLIRALAPILLTLIVLGAIAYAINETTERFK